MIMSHKEILTGRRGKGAVPALTASARENPVTEDQFVKTTSRLIDALKIWADETGVPRSELAVMLASAAGELGTRKYAGRSGGVALLRRVADTIEQQDPGCESTPKRLNMLEKLRIVR